jgi:hypothetical protein
MAACTQPKCSARKTLRPDLQLNTRTDPETMRILNDDVVPACWSILMEWSWSPTGDMREPDERRRSMSNAAALSELHRSRQQSRLLHDESAGK